MLLLWTLRALLVFLGLWLAEGLPEYVKQYLPLLTSQLLRHV